LRAIDSLGVIAVAAIDEILAGRKLAQISDLSA
jgi:hypothetical protein